MKPGEEKPAIVTEPLHDPFPKPEPKPEREPEPVKVPEKVPAQIGDKIRMSRNFVAYRRRSHVGDV